MNASEARRPVPKPFATLPPRTDRREYPCNLKPEDVDRFKITETYEMPGAGVDVLPDVTAPDRGPLRSDGEMVWESFVNVREAEKWLRRRGPWRQRLEQIISRRSTLEEPAIWITDSWSFGYFHFMLDALQRLELASRSYDLSKLTLLLPSKCKRFKYITDSLQSFDLKAVRVLRRFEQLRCPEVIFPNHVASTGNQDRGLMDDLRQRLIDHVDTTPTSKPTESKRIYISRRNARGRRIRNESSILPILKRHGFDEFVAEDHDWKTQIRVCAHADHIVSSHGGGLTNMMVMRPGSRVLELRSSTGLTPNCFSNLASATGLKFFYQLCRQTDTKETAHRSDLLVDVAELDRTLTQFVNSTGRTQAVLEAA